MRTRCLGPPAVEILLRPTVSICRCVVGTGAVRESDRESGRESDRESGRECSPLRRKLARFGFNERELTNERCLRPLDISRRQTLS